MKLNEIEWDAEGLQDMEFQAEYMNALYDSCTKDCNTCPLYKQVNYFSTTICQIITHSRKRIFEAIEKILDK